MQAPEWVRERLDNWGRWMSERQAGGSGYPRANVLAGWRGAPRAADWVPVDGVAALDTHCAVQALRVPNVRLWAALNCRYVGDPTERASRRRPMTHAEIATLLHTSEPTARAWVLEGELAVMVALDSGRPLPATA